MAAVKSAIPGQAMNAESTSRKGSNEMMDSIQFIRGECSKIGNIESTLHSYMDSQRNEMQRIHNNVATNTQDIDDLFTRITACENTSAYLIHFHELQKQTDLRNNVALHCVPISKNEDILAIVFSICNFIGVSLEQEDVVSAKRIRNSRTQIIIVKFASANIKDDVMKAQKTRTITTASILLGNTADKRNKIFVRSHVLPHFNRIMAYGRRLIKEGKLFACWMTASGVFVRRYRDGHPELIYNCDHIDDLITTAQDN